MLAIVKAGDKPDCYLQVTASNAMRLYWRRELREMRCVTVRSIARGDAVWCSTDSEHETVDETTPEGEAMENERQRIAWDARRALFDAAGLDPLRLAIVRDCILTRRRRHRDIAERFDVSRQLVGHIAKKLVDESRAEVMG